MSRLLKSLALCAITATSAFAQIQFTHTDCNPRNGTCPENPALGTTFETDFNSSMSEFDPRFFNVTAGAQFISFTDEGADLTISSQGDSITVKSAYYIFFGRVELIFRAAKGQGIISTLITLSDTLDEIDWEVRGGIEQNVTNTYFGWGNTTQFNGEEPSTADWPGGAMGDFHNYTIDWTQEKIDYLLDGNVVRTAPYSEPGTYPQTPSFVRFGIWAGGDPDLPKGTNDWAGGKTDYSAGPFTMTVKSLKVTDAHQNVSWYSYGDQSGSWESIKMTDGESNAFKAIHEKSTAQKAQEEWQGLSTGAKIGIAGGVVGLFAVCFAVFIWYCMRQRKAGKEEKAKADREWDGHQAELMEYKERMKRGDFAISHLGHGEKF